MDGRVHLSILLIGQWVFPPFPASFLRPCHTKLVLTSQGGEMSRVPASHSGRSGNPKVAGSNPDLTFFEPCSSQTDDFKIEMYYSMAWHLALVR